MASENDKDLETYKASLRRQEMHWRAQFESVQQNDRAAIDIGLTALKTALLINAGAVVALLAFAAQRWDNEAKKMIKVLDGSELFVWGLFCAAVAVGVAYFYQSAVTARADDALTEISRTAGDFRPRVWVSKLANCTRAAMVSLTVLSYAFFLAGVQRAIDVISPG